MRREDEVWEPETPRTERDDMLHCGGMDNAVLANSIPIGKTWCKLCGGEGCRECDWEGAVDVR